VKVAVADRQAPFARGGAEQLAERLVARIAELGHAAELVRVPFRREPSAVLPKQLAIASHIDLSAADRVIALRFPAHLIPHESKVLWLLQPDGEADGPADAPGVPGGEDDDPVREHLAAAERRAFAESRAIFVDSPAARDRLRRSHGVDAEVLPAPIDGDESSRPAWSAVLERLLA